MKRLFHLAAGALLMLFVALVMAFAAIRLGLHGREVAVPSFAGMSNTEAESLAGKLGLNLAVENRYYSTAIAANHVLSQSPSPGSRVRRGWQVRVTESLGGQRVDIPDVVGQPERLAELALRRLAVETGTVAHLPAPGPYGIVLAQSPPANSTGAEGPRVSLLLADEPSRASAYGFVMPPIAGLSLRAAAQRLETAGLRITSIVQPHPVATEGMEASADASVVGDLPEPELVPFTQNSIIATQSPQPGKRVARGDPIRVTLNR